VGTGVLVADDLAPSDVAGLDVSSIRAIVTAGGSPTGHPAILARARGIPAVVAAGPSVLRLRPGTVVAIDGSQGELVVDPPPDVVARWRARAARDRARSRSALAAAARAAVTGDGVRVAVGANLGSVEDAEQAARCGADLAGLVRTEFLFLDRSEPPSVEEQTDAYLELARALGGRRLTLRTLDVGGDKPLPYAAQRPEANPFLGMRGIRLALREGGLLSDQLTAVVRAARETPVSVMFPMVSGVAELLEARRRLEQAVHAESLGWPDGLEVGVMVEVPSAALSAAALAPHVDFFSVGTNDLTQYTLAAERGNPDVAALADALDPAVLTLIDAVCRAAGDRVQVGVCGELAADERATPLLVALGIRELSVAPFSVPIVKEAVRRAERADDPDLVKRCVTASSPAEVRSLLD
jgi:phosphocarrier protein FPr